MITTELILNIDELNKYEDEWDQLLDISFSDNIFLCFDWIATWWKHFETPKRKLQVIIIREQDNIIGIAPFYKEEVNPVWCKSLSWTELRFIGHGDVVSPDYLDIIAKPNYEYIIISNILNYVITSREYDIINFTDIASSSHIIRVLQKDYICDRTFQMENQIRFICPYLDLPTKWDDYKKSLSQNMRGNLSRKINKLSRKFNVEFKIHGKSDDITADMNTLAKLHQKRMISIGEKGSFSQGEYMSFHHEVARRLKEQDCLYLSTLLLNDEPVAMQYGFLKNSKYYFYQGGFSPEYSHENVGFVLMSYIIQNLIDRKVNKFYFLRGEEEYKFHWTKQEDHTLEFKIIKNNIRTKLYKFDSFIKYSGRYIFRMLRNKLVRSS